MYKPKDYIEFYSSLVSKVKNNIDIKIERIENAKAAKEYMRLYEWLQSEYDKAEGEKKERLKEAIYEMESRLGEKGVYVFSEKAVERYNKKRERESKKDFEKI